MTSNQLEQAAGPMGYVPTNRGTNCDSEEQIVDNANDMENLMENLGIKV